MHSIHLTTIQDTSTNKAVTTFMKRIRAHKEPFVQSFIHSFSFLSPTFNHLKNAFCMSKTPRPFIHSFIHSFSPSLAFGQAPPTYRVILEYTETFTQVPSRPTESASGSRRPVTRGNGQFSPKGLHSCTINISIAQSLKFHNHLG